MKSFILLALTLALAITAMAQDKEEVQAVLQLLADLKNNANNELNALDQAWSKAAARKQAVIESLTESAQQQRFECAAREQEVVSKTADIETTKKFIEWMQKRQTSNSARTGTLDETNCHRTNNYVTDIKNDKVGLTLAQFLKRELRNLDESKLSLIETQQWATKVQRFVKLYNSGRLYAMVQVHSNDNGDFEFTEEDDEADTLLVLENDADIELEDSESEAVGVTVEHEPLVLEDDSEEPQVTGSAPRPTGSRPQASLQSTTDDLIQLLDDYENYIRENLDHSQNLQVNSALTFIDFRSAIDRENETYDRHIKEETDSLVRLGNQLTNKKQASNLCQARLVQITQAFQISQEDLKLSQTNYDEQRAGKLEEIKVFEEVYRIYVNQVATD